MPESFEFLIWLVVLGALWLRGLANAARKARQREQQAIGGEDEQVGVAASEAQIRRRPMREQWLEMARQIERQMQQAAEEGRPGRMVPHVEEDDPDESIMIPGRGVRPRRTPEEAQAAEVLPAPYDPATVTRRESRAVVSPETLERARRRPRPGREWSAVPGAARRRPSTRPAAESDPLGRLSRYSPLARAVILSEILGSPAGLKEDRWDEKWGPDA